ncbi:unnamed protein product [Mytilus coruscus]|uniref:Uncharacterized protein n=1 Tax=Mytilus coruscus TaxID=42192 RepID=A0A6J8CA04_MYTCO|nr:unnamed protein product [Mytilus coruscus]
MVRTTGYVLNAKMDRNQEEVAHAYRVILGCTAKTVQMIVIVQNMKDATELQGIVVEKLVQLKECHLFMSIKMETLLSSSIWKTSTTKSNIIGRPICLHPCVLMGGCLNDYTKPSEYKKKTTSHLQQITHTSQEKTTEETNTRSSTGKEEEHNDDFLEINVLGLSKRGVAVYIISIVGIIIILLILYICRHFKRKQQMATSQHNTFPQHEEIVEIDILNVEGIYDLIDENLVDDSFIHQHEIPTNPYLEVMGSLNSDSYSDGVNESPESSDESHRDGDGQNISTSYLNAYHPLAENWSNKTHVYDHIGVAMIVDSDQCSQNCRTSSVISPNCMCSHIDNTKEKQQVRIGLLLTNGKHQSQSSSPLYMHRSEQIEASLVMYRRKSF